MTYFLHTKRCYRNLFRWPDQHSLQKDQCNVLPSTADLHHMAMNMPTNFPKSANHHLKIGATKIRRRE